MPAPNYEIVVHTIEAEDGPDTYTAECQVYKGTRAACGYTTSGWPNPEVAEARLRQHHTEHQTGVHAPELYEFRTGERHPDWVDDGDPNVPVEGIPADSTGTEG